MFDTISQHVDHRAGSGFAASAGFHLAIVGAVFGISRLMIANVIEPASQPVTRFPTLPSVIFNLHPHGSVHPASSPRAAKHIAHALQRSVLQQPTDHVRPTVATAPQAPADTPDTSDAGDSAQLGTPEGVGEGSPGGGAAQSEYLQLSHAPARIAGEEQPALTPSLLMQLRGSKAVVLARISINARGEVDSVDILNSNAPPELAQAVRRLIQSSWKFEAPTNGGRATGVKFLQAFRFVF